jgi:hypothetical protein
MREITRARVAIGGIGCEGTERAQTVGRAMAAQVAEALLNRIDEAGQIMKALIIEDMDGA